jgi:hypothetical protein
MSIVNDALKKAGQGFEPGEKKSADPIKNVSSASDKKWTAIITVTLVIIASLYGSLILYKGISNSDPVAASYVSTNKPVAAVQSALNSIEKSTNPRPMRSKDAMKLSGIMYGDQGKWAIVDNRVVKEGDAILGGEITSITRELVKIEKKDGSELTLNLK